MIKIYNPVDNALVREVTDIDARMLIANRVVSPVGRGTSRRLIVLVDPGVVLSILRGCQHPLNQASKTTIREFLDGGSRIYQHHRRRCQAYAPESR